MLITFVLFLILMISLVFLSTGYMTMISTYLIPFTPIIPLFQLALLLKRTQSGAYPGMFVVMAVSPLHGETVFKKFLS